jgi:hypothetical protein
MEFLMNLTNLTANWRTTAMALIPLVAYGLKYAGVWPESMPLPPMDEVWPFLLSIVGIGITAKDNNVTNAATPSPPTTL